MEIRQPHVPPNDPNENKTTASCGGVWGETPRGGSGVFHTIAPYGAMMGNSRVGGDFPHQTKKLNLREQVRHFDGCQSGFSAFISGFGARAVNRLIERFCRHDAISHG